jgi:hypothetical protein
MEETQKLLIENFDEDIHDLLRVQLAEAEKRLDKIARIFWALTKHQLVELAEFNDEKYQLSLNATPYFKMHQVECPKGRYELIQKGVEPAPNHHILRMNHALGEFIIDSAKFHANIIT